MPEYVKRCTTHHVACDCREWKFEQLEAENAKLRKYRDVMETAHGKRLYEMEMLREHFDDAGELRGDGRWRLRQIAEALKNLDEGSQLASQLFDGEYENRLKELEAENAKLRALILHIRIHGFNPNTIQADELDKLLKGGGDE